MEGDEQEGLRAQKTARVTGARHGVLTEPEPQGGAVTVGYVTAPGPLLVPPVLGGGDTLDDATVSFLLAQALLERQELQEMEDAAKRREEQRLKRQTVEEAKAVHSWFYWLRCSSRCFLRCRQAQMLGILAGMEQIDSYAVGWFCLSRCTSRCIPSCCPQAPDACHHGRYGPEAMLRVAVQKTADFLQLQFLAGRRFFLLRCGGRFPWSCCSADHRDSPVASVHVVDAPGC